MGGLTNLLKSADQHGIDHVESDESRTVAGGCLTVGQFAAFLVWVLLYTLLPISTKSFMRDTTTTTSVLTFPSRGEARSDDDAGTPHFYFPKMNCVAEGGCYVRPADKAMCFFVAQWEEVPTPLLYARYNSDPIDGLTVLWDGNMGQSFGLSYEVRALGSTPEQIYEGATEKEVALKTEAGQAEGTTAFQVYNRVHRLHRFERRNECKTTKNRCVRWW